MSQITVLEHDPYPAEQYDDPAQQREAATLGTWTFLATEVLFFGALFVGFYAMRLRWPHDFADAARDLKWYLGALNTGVLLGSSYAMALAVRAASEGDQRRLVRRLLVTIALGLVFVGVKFTEYAIEYHDHLVPGLNFSPVSPDEAGLPPDQRHPRAPHAPLFMTFYFVMTGFHALHMTIGIGVLSVVTFFARRGKYSAAYHNPVEMVGLYWHFVDTVWVFVFPTLYLLRSA
jgi:cytochrome c oxidase subunit 3